MPTMKSRKPGYSPRQLDALAAHARAQLAYKAGPSSATAAALLAARRKVAQLCGGSDDAHSITDSVRIRREHMPAGR